MANYFTPRVVGNEGVALPPNLRLDSACPFRDSVPMAGTVDNALLAEIVRRITRVAAPQRIILFGSAARGTMTQDSDIDLLILESTDEHPRERMVLLRDQLDGLGFPFDVIVMDPERFEQTKDALGGLAYPANKHGRVIYEAA